jgi:hypothetical protein
MSSSTQNDLYNRNSRYYNTTGAGRLQKDAGALDRIKRAYGDPLSGTKDNALASAMNALGDEDQVGGVQGWRIKQDLQAANAVQAYRQRVMSLKGKDLDDELKRKEIMMPRRI